jgi:AefR-like transcriptional repressor, C-terminal domain
VGRADGYIGRGRGWYFSAVPELNERKWHWRNADQGESAEVHVCVQRSRLFAKPAARFRAAFFEHGPGRASAYVAQVLDEFARRGMLKLTDSQLAAELFVSMLRGDLHLRVVLGLRPPPDDAEIERFVQAAVRTFLDGCRTPGERIAGPSERKGAKSHA